MEGSRAVCPTWTFGGSNDEKGEDQQIQQIQPEIRC